MIPCCKPTDPRKQLWVCKCELCMAPLAPGGINRGNDDVPPIQFGSIRYAVPDEPRKVGAHPALGMGYAAPFPHPPAPRAHSHYFKPCPFAEVDVYRVLALFAVTDPCLQHAVKKLLVAGGRGAGKDISQDVKEAVDTLARWQEMRAEEVGS